MHRRFGLPYWQFSLTATDANRWMLRICRHVTGRPKVLVFNWCYHGSVDEAFVTRGADGRERSRVGNVGPQVDPAQTTRVAEFNEIESVEAALAHGDVACVLMEPALTNIGIVLPEDGFLGRGARGLHAHRHAADHRRDAHAAARARAAARRRGGSSPTRSRSASRSAAACRSAPTA